MVCIVKRRYWALAALVAVMALVAPLMAMADTIKGDLTADHRDAEVSSDTVIQGDVRVSHGNATIKGKVDGQVWVSHGNLELSGEVSGDVHVDHGNAHAASTAKISGTLFADHTTVQKDDGAQVSSLVDGRGGTTPPAPPGTAPEAGGADVGGVHFGPDGITGPSFSIGPGGVHFPGFTAGPDGVQAPGFMAGPTGVHVGGFGHLADFWGFFNPVLTFFRWAALFAVGLVVIAIWPTPVENMVALLDSNPTRTFVAGLMALVVFLIGAVGLLITIIGIPLVLVLAIAFGLAWFAGYLALAIYLGHKLGNAFPQLSGNHPLFMPFLVGSIALALASFIPIVGPLVSAAAWLFAVGVVYQSFFGTAWPRLGHRTAN